MFLDLDGRRLHHESAGDGDVTVVFEAGLGMSGIGWALVAPSVARETRAVVYDRAGLGGSDKDPFPRTVERLADDLGAVLRSLPGPFVLVGHSWGGPIVRVLAARNQFDVRALVLVDPSDERDDDFFTPSTARRMAVAGPLTRALAALGVYRAAARIGSALPPAAFARFRSENFGRAAARTFQAEIRHFLPGLAALRATPPNLGDLPVTIISAGTRSNLQAAHAASATRHIIADGSGHNVMFDRPELIVDEILAYVGNLRP